MRVAVRADRHQGPPLPRDGGQGVFGRLVALSKVDPPHQVRQCQAQGGHGHEREVDVEAGGAHADGHNGLAERDDHDKSVPLGEQPGELGEREDEDV